MEDRFHQRELNIIPVSKVRFEHLPQSVFVTNFRFHYCPICSHKLNRNYSYALRVNEKDAVKTVGAYCHQCNVFFGDEHLILNEFANNSFNKNVSLHKQFFLRNYAQYIKRLNNCNSLLYQFYLSGKNGLKVFSIVTDTNEVDESQGIITYDFKRARKLIRAYANRESIVNINHNYYLIQRVRKPDDWQKNKTIYNELYSHVKEREVVDFEVPEYDISQPVYVYYGTTACERTHHIKDYRGILKYNEKTVELYCDYCYECQEFFMKYKNYEKLLNNYGFFPLRIEFLFDDFPNNSFNRREKSLLYLYGYSVNGANGLTDRKRQEILAFLMDFEIMSKNEILNHLQMLIDTNGKQYKNRFAVLKWEEDKQFVLNYKLQEHPSILIESLHRG